MGRDRIEWIRYFAKVPKLFVREWPSGLIRQTKLAGYDLTRDESWTTDLQWERSLYFIAPQFGSSDVRVPLIEVSEAEAELIREMLTVRPRGGPFTPAGQAWLAAHPEDRAAKYLGVTPPVYDRAGRVVTPLGLVPDKPEPPPR